MQKRCIPNILSALRLCMVPLFVYVFFLHYPQNRWYALLIFFLAGLTDVLDGWLARRNRWISNVGKILDPVADKTMQVAALACLYVKEIIPLWLLLAYVFKELLMLIGAVVIFRKQSVVVKSSFWGKFAVCVFYASIAALVGLQIASDAVRDTWTGVISAVMVCFAAVALVQYVREYMQKQF